MKNPYLKRAYAESEYTPDSVSELRKCSNDPIYFLTNYVKVAHPTKGSVPFALFDYQIDMVKSIHENKDVVILASRQLGKTTVVAMYILWFSLFQTDKNCVIASKAMNHATEIMSRIKFAYEELPDWLKAGCKFYNRTSIEFDNGSKIKCEATSEKTGRGGSPSILFIDEIAFISRRVQEEMWASITPSLSTGGKFILTSTPNGDTDLFASIWTGANAGTNSFVPIQVMWHQHPERGPEYYEEMLGKLGPVKTRQELDCEFLSSDALLIDSRRIHSLKARHPIREDMGFKFFKELTGNGTYLVGVDPATGNQQDFTAIEVFEFPSLEQVAELRLNVVNIPLVYSKIKWLLRELRKPVNGKKADVIWSFERNGIGEAIVALIQNDDSADGGVYLDGVELFSDSPTKLGCFTSGKSKLVSCMQIKQLVERMTGGMTLHSAALLTEFKHYVARGGSFAAKNGSTDDLISACLIVGRLLARLASYDEGARKMVYENVDPSVNEYSAAGQEDSNDAFGDEPVPFSIM
jgi:hypothetical protein